MELIEKKGLPPLLSGTDVACTIKCYNKAKGASRRLAWNEDGPGGPKDPGNSERILLECMLEPGNCNTSKNNGGVSKVRYSILMSLSHSENEVDDEDGKKAEQEDGKVAAKRKEAPPALSTAHKSFIIH